MFKLKNILLSVVIGGAILLTSCDPESSLTAPSAPNTGSADFSSFVAIGNSLTAGYQNGCLYESAQNFSFPKLIANQVEVDFHQPLYSDPGTGGRMELESLQPLSIVTNTDTGTFLNQNHPLPFNNLGVPGALLYDVLNATNSQNCASALFSSSPNPYFDIVLRNQGTTVLQQATALNPTFTTVWIGNNDVLGFALSGGTAPTAPTDLATFEALYTGVITGLKATGTNAVCGTIPSVTSIPYFTTVGPMVAAGVSDAMTQNPAILGLFYQKHGEIVGSGLATPTQLLANEVLVTLTAKNFTGYLGQPTGAYYTSQSLPIPEGIDINQPFGFHPQNPLPDALILDTTEIQTILDHVDGYNRIIRKLCDNNGFYVADIHALLRNIELNTMTIDGITFTCDYITGGTFSLDGIHPNNQGSAVVANEFIKVINSKYNAKIPLINVSTVPGGIFLTDKVNDFKLDAPVFMKYIY